MKVRLKKTVKLEAPKARPQSPSVAAAPKSFIRPVLNRATCDPTKQLIVHELVVRVVALAQTMKERQFYPYQVELASRIVEAMLEHDGETITALMARQSGKTECVGAIVAAIVVILPTLAKQFSEDWHLNLTDDAGVYRGYAFGVKAGIYAPRLDQSAIMFDRVKQALETDTAKQVLAELNITLEVSNGNTVRLSNGSRVLCESASEQSKIEGETHHLLIAEEAQDIGDVKMRKSIHPMIAATGGVLVKVGTATTQKCDFYTAIKQNERSQLVTGKRNHFFYPYVVVQNYNSLYRDYVEKEKIKMGEDSDEFRTSYCGEWIFERGMFVTIEQLFHSEVAQQFGRFSMRYPAGLPKDMPQSPIYSICAGIDWGSAHDSTVVTLLGVNWTEPLEEGDATNWSGQYHYAFYQKHVLDWWESIGDNYEVQFAEVIDYLRSIRNLRKITTDSNGCGKPLFDRLTATMAQSDIDVEEFNFQAKLKSDGYKSLYADICGHRLTFPAGDQVRRSIQYRRFTNQMLDLRKTYKGLVMQVAHPEEKDAHDDYPDSLMLAAWGANVPTNSSTVDFLDANVFYR